MDNPKSNKKRSGEGGGGSTTPAKPAKKPSPLRVVSPIHKANRQMSLYLGGEMPTDEVSPGECHILGYLAAYGPCPITELVRVFGYRKSTMSSTLDRLVERGLATRELNAEDRRSFLVDTTKTGNRVAAAARAPVERFDREILRRVSRRDLEGFERVMQTITDITEIDVRRDDSDSS